MPETMQFISAATVETDLERALLVLQANLEYQDRPEEIDLVLVFISAHFTHNVRQIATRLREILQPAAIIGCTAESVISREQEIENQAAISLIAGRLPQVTATPFWLQTVDADWPRLLLDQDEFERRVDPPPDTRLFILLGDPFSSPMDDILQAFNQYYPEIPLVGGMASGALRPSGNALIVNDQVLNEGVVGIALSGALEPDIIVSQGCRPIWRPFKITSARANIIYELEGRPPMAWLEELIPELPEDERALLENGLFVGRAVSSREILGRGDFLIRGVMGIDQDNGAIVINDSIIDGEMVQFHVRDALTAQEDLEMLLIPQSFRAPALGGLLFNCNGRGLRLYDHPNGDISLIQNNLNQVHMAGFFCAGEIGPLGSASYLHGHTASLVLFRPQST